MLGLGSGSVYPYLGRLVYVRVESDLVDAPIAALVRVCVCVCVCVCVFD